MSYREENGQVILTMSREDYKQLIVAFGYVADLAATDFSDPDGFPRFIALMNRLNEANPNYTSYQVEAKKS